MRAVVLGPGGEPELRDVPEPEGPGEVVRVLACGLCGSDVEKLGDPSRAGAVLGHEVVARTEGGQRVALVHHTSCGTCERCREGHESLCESFAAATIVPGGLAERVAATEWVELPEAIDDARGTMVEPLACVLRGLRCVPPGDALVVGHGFVGHLFAAALRHRGDRVFAIDADPRRAGPSPGEPVDTAIVCGRGGAGSALAAVRPGGTILVFADGGQIPAGPVYRNELTVLGVRSASPVTMREAVALLPELDLPEPTVLPLQRFHTAVDLFRRRDALKVVLVP
ncbi:MAG: alcohol dehydrogenase catalytic domain-containing protein [Thermoleophilia bacterium]|nr:alcohol dehydrogenase catalytic domain-containing protein [Thermoleophilia bacterium]